MNVGYLVTRSSCYFPDRTAFVIDGQSISYQALNRRINRLANALLSLGLEKGDRVGLLFHNSLPYLESYLALYKAGLVWVRLNARLHPTEIKGMIQDSDQVMFGLKWVPAKYSCPGLPIASGEEVKACQTRRFKPSQRA